MKSIAKKLVKVMSDCDYVQKDGKNDFHNYKYVSAANILVKVNEALVKNGLASFATPELISFEDVKTIKGNTEHLATVKMIVTVMDIDSDETIQIIGLGSGQDVGDKAIMKAQTAALKYAWMLTLNISTGDDPEADSSVDERMSKQAASTTTRTTTTQREVHTATTAQINAIKKIAESKKVDISKHDLNIMTTAQASNLIKELQAA